MKCFVLLIFVGWTTSWVSGQEGVFPLRTDPIRGWEVISTRIFDGSGLWGYIDGGADIYIEYGFERVYVQEVMFRDHLLKIEAFCMTDPVAAFGIFSVNRFRCTLNDSLPVYHCISPYQILAVLGGYYLILSDQEGNPAATQCGIRLLKGLSEKIQPESFRLPEPFSTEDAQGRLKCIRGKLGLMNELPSLSDLLESVENFTLYALPLEGERPDQVLALIEFAERSGQADFLDRLTTFQANHPELVVFKKTVGSNSVLFMTANQKEVNSLYPYRELFTDK
jgi:hypothetical protein